MKWIQRGVSLLAALVVSYIIWWLIVHYDGADADLVAVIAFVFNVVLYFMGRSDAHAEHNSEANR